MRRKHFWIKFSHGESTGKISFWAPSDKYKPNIWPILGMGQMSIEEYKNVIRANRKEVGVRKVYCLCEKDEATKVISLLCSSDHLGDAVALLPGKYVYDWVIQDAYLKYSDVPIF